MEAKKDKKERGEEKRGEMKTVFGGEGVLIRACLECGAY